MVSSKGFFRGLVTYMASGPVCAMVWEGLNAVKTGRVMLGETNPAASLPGTIRGDYAVQVGRNICHGYMKTSSLLSKKRSWCEGSGWSNKSFLNLATGSIYSCDVISLL